MTRDIERGASPTDIAMRRSRKLADPLDQQVFLEGFAQARVAEDSNDDRLYLWLREALDHEDSARVAGLIEGAASCVTPGDGKKKVL